MPLLQFDFQILEFYTIKNLLKYGKAENEYVFLKDLFGGSKI